jgi:hypothetical protein
MPSDDTEIQVIKSGRGIQIQYRLQEQTTLAVENCTHRYSVTFDHAMVVFGAHELPQPDELSAMVWAATVRAQQDAPTSSGIKRAEFKPISRPRTTKARGSENHSQRSESRRR